MALSLFSKEVYVPAPSRTTLLVWTRLLAMPCDAANSCLVGMSRCKTLGWVEFQLYDMGATPWWKYSCPYFRTAIPLIKLPE